MASSVENEQFSLLAGKTATEIPPQFIYVKIILACNQLTSVAEIIVTDKQV